jgi:hypothetical protein
MRRLRRSIVLVLSFLLCAFAVLGPGSAGAAENPAVADCAANGGLTGHYSLQQLQSALRTMPATVKEYTNCSDVIQRKLNDLLGSNRSSPGAAAGGGSGGSILPTPLIVTLGALAIAAAAFATLALRSRHRQGL